DMRLTEIGYQNGMISEERHTKFLAKKAQIDAEIEHLRKISIKPTDEVQAIIAEAGGAALREPMKAADLLKRPEMKYSELCKVVPPLEEISDEVAEQVEIFIKYEGYIEKSMQQVARMKKMENKRIPENIDYDAISGI